MARRKKLTPEMQQDLFALEELPDEGSEETAEPEAEQPDDKPALRKRARRKPAVEGELFAEFADGAPQEALPSATTKKDEDAMREKDETDAEPISEATEDAAQDQESDRLVAGKEALEAAEAESLEATDSALSAADAPKSRTDVVEEALSLVEENNEQLTLARFASKAYLEYAISVVKGRALPDLCDGQKPVQRRILYAMHRMGLNPSAKQVKSARVVGDVLGKYHPHGDSAAYDAMVRMAQDFTMRYPLVDGHGNFGSRDGDGAAAMRYTEAKLTQYAELLLSELDEGTVNYIPNYDGAFKEPVMLPSRMPFVLLNGASGIAVGMATEIPSHNMREVAEASAALIENPALTLDEALKLMPGPDLPGGAQVISSKKEIREVYRTGYGSLQMRASYHFEELARGQWQLVVTALPYKISTQKILSEIESITNPKPSGGKKTLSAKQTQEKMLMLNVLDKARDESDKEIDVRIVFEPRSKSVNREEFANILFAKTSLEYGCKFNMISIGIDGKPRQKGLLEILGEWNEFRIKTVRRRCAYRLQAIEDRIEVLEGRLLVLLSIDEVIRIIREADDPKAELQTRFALSERQVEDILEIKLRQLAKLEDVKLRKELEEKQKEEGRLKALLESEKKLRALVVSELRSDAAKFGDARRTLIEESEGSTVTQRIVDEPTTVVISEKGFIRTRAAHNIDACSLSFKLGDGYLADFECRSVDQLVLLSNLGRAYSIAVSDLPNARGDGTHVSAFVQFTEGERPVAWFAGDGATTLLIASDKSMGFVCKAENLVVRQKAGKTFFDMEEGAAVLTMVPLREGQTHLAALSEGGRLVVFALDEIGERSSGGKGVLLMDIPSNEKLIAALPCSESGVIVCGIGRGNKPQELSIGPRLVEEYKCRRARKGKAVQAKWKFTGLLPGKADQKTSDGVLIE